MQINSSKALKSSVKAWEECMCWLRSKNIKTIKDFKAECELKWFVNNISERSHVKENNDVHKVYKKSN